MALTVKDRKQLFTLLIAVAIAAAGIFWVYWRGPAQARAQELQAQIDTLRARVDSAKADLREGTVEVLRQRVDGFERSLVLMRQLVPTENEVTNLIDEVSTRAQVRDVRILDISPLSPELETPFTVYRYRFSVIGEYDQIGEFLSDVASLDRIMVPDELGLTLSTAEITETDTEANPLVASFVLRTFVKAEGDVMLGDTGGN